jgi:hypothetical protein
LGGLSRLGLGCFRGLGVSHVRRRRTCAERNERWKEEGRAWEWEKVERGRGLTEST